MRTVSPRTVRVQFAVAALTLATAVPACGGDEPPRPAAAERAPAPSSATAPAPAPPQDGRRAREERPAHTHGAWSRPRLMRELERRRIRVQGHMIRLDAATITCGGEGRGRVRAGRRRWTHFRCVQPTFPRGTFAGPDAVFRVHASRGRRLVASDGRLTRYDAGG